jgi:hypothetical protein
LFVTAALDTGERASIDGLEQPHGVDVPALDEKDRRLGDVEQRERGPSPRVGLTEIEQHCAGVLGPTFIDGALEVAAGSSDDDALGGPCGSVGSEQHEWE